MPVGQVELGIFGDFLPRIGVLARLDLPAALKYANSSPGTRQARGGDAAAVTRPNDDDFVMVLKVTY